MAIKIIKINPNSGNNMTTIDKRIAAKSSINEKIGLPMPPVNNEEKPLIVTVDNWKEPVIPRPQIMDKIHCNPGVISLKDEEARIIPAKIENGVATISSKLSNSGMKVENTSTRAAIVNNIIIQSFPIHNQESLSPTKPAL